MNRFADMVPVPDGFQHLHGRHLEQDRLSGDFCVVCRLLRRHWRMAENCQWTHRVDCLCWRYWGCWLIDWFTNQHRPAACAPEHVPHRAHGHQQSTVVRVSWTRERAVLKVKLVSSAANVKKACVRAKRIRMKWWGNPWSTFWNWYHFSFAILDPFTQSRRLDLRRRSSIDWYLRARLRLNWWKLCWWSNLWGWCRVLWQCVRVCHWKYRSK